MGIIEFLACLAAPTSEEKELFSSSSSSPCCSRGSKRENHEEKEREGPLRIHLPPVPSTSWLSRWGEERENRPASLCCECAHKTIYFTTDITRESEGGKRRGERVAD